MSNEYIAPAVLLVLLAGTGARVFSRSARSPPASPFPAPPCSAKAAFPIGKASKPIRIPRRNDLVYPVYEGARFLGISFLLWLLLTHLGLGKLTLGGLSVKVAALV